MPSRKGIAIGIGYKNTKISALTGTVNDSVNIGRLLTTKYNYGITYLNDLRNSKTSSKYPSKKNIVYWIKKLLREAKDGDELFIGYTGHGVQLQYDSSNVEELDNKDEAIIPVDYNFKSLRLSNSCQMIKWLSCSIYF